MHHLNSKKQSKKSNNDENSSEEGDEKGGEPLVGLVVAEHDAVRPQEKDGHKDDRDAKGPADEDAKPR